MLLLVSCARPATGTLTGVVTDVQSNSILEWTSITVRDRSGRELTFLRGDGVDLRFWRASHLREHMLFSTPVKVTYHETQQGLEEIGRAHV